MDDLMNLSDALEWNKDYDLLELVYDNRISNKPVLEIVGFNKRYGNIQEQLEADYEKLTPEQREELFEYIETFPAYARRAESKL